MSRDNKKIATLWDRGNDDHDDHSHQEGQAFYAGGSEHSGQQILGPNRDSSSDDLIENLFQHARRSATMANDGNDSMPPTSGNGVSLPIVFWRNGFTVGDDETLREYGAAENRQFLECLRRGETPPELVSRVRGGMIEVKLQHKAGQDFKPERKLQAFSGEGFRLGAPSPSTVSESDTNSQQMAATATPSSGLVVDETQPCTTIQIRLVDNSRLQIRANLTHTVGDLVSHVRATRPQYSGVNFVLATTFPAKELSNLEQTIKDASLANASLLQKIKPQS